MNKNNNNNLNNTLFSKAIQIEKYQSSYFKNLLFSTHKTYGPYVNHTSK